MKYILTIAAVLFGSTCWAQSQRCNVLLLDGSRVTGVLAEESLEVDTKYGKLSVPWKEVHTIKLGLHYPDGAKDQIDKALKSLGSGAFKERSAAHQKLIDMGTISYLMVSEQLGKKNELEVQRRVETIKKSIEDKYQSSEIRTAGFDTINSVETTVKGNLVKRAIKLKNPHLGELTIGLADIDMISFSQDTNLKVDAGKYGTHEGKEWLDTGIWVGKGQAVVLKATGQADMYPQQVGTYNATPGGLGSTWHGQRRSGVLMGKIGDGAEFEVGENHTARGIENGKLYLRINGVPWPGTAPTGEYEVKITTKY